MPMTRTLTRLALSVWTRLAAVALISACSAPSSSVSAQSVDPGALTVTLQPVAQGFREPIGVTYAPDGSGRLFVVERRGVIRVIEGGNVRPTPFLDISPIVGSGGQEQGLLGLAFHPSYVENGQFFVN